MNDSKFILGLHAYNDFISGRRHAWVSTSFIAQETIYKRELKYKHSTYGLFDPKIITGKRCKDLNITHIRDCLYKNHEKNNPTLFAVESKSPVNGEPMQHSRYWVFDGKKDERVLSTFMYEWTNSYAHYDGIKSHCVTWSTQIVDASLKEAKIQEQFWTPELYGGNLTQGVMQRIQEYNVQDQTQQQVIKSKISEIAQKEHEQSQAQNQKQIISIDR